MAQEPAMKDGTPDVGRRTKLTLTCDQRVADDALEANFLAALGSYIEDPSRLNG